MTKRFSAARRAFIENLILIVPAVAVAPWVTACTRSEKASSPSAEGLPEGVEPVREEIGTAKALQYHHDASEAPVAMRAANSDQFCHNCQHYKAYEGSRFGNCALIPEGAVSANGWCNAWVARAPG